MNFLARLCLKLSVLIFLYCAVLLVWITRPNSVWVVLVVFLVLLRRGRRRRLTLDAHGTAAFCDEESLRNAGWLDAPRGMYIGLLVGVSRLTLWARIRAVFDGSLSAQEACRRFFLAFSLTRPPAPVVRMPQPVSTVCFMPSGGGKSSGLVIPFLMTAKDSCVVLDPSGELALATATARHLMGSEIHLLDPYRLTAKKLPFKPAARNVLDGIPKGSPHAVDLCNALAQALVTRRGDEKETHFLDMAEEFLSAVIQNVVEHAEPQKRSLQLVADILANPANLDTTIRLGMESRAWGGMLARNSAKLLNSVDKERSSTLTTCSRMLRWLSTPAMASVTTHSTFDPANLKRHRRPMSFYVILPLEYLAAQAGWLRSTVNDLIMAVVQQGPDESRLVHYVFDESSSLGTNLESAEGLVDKFRKYGTRTQWYYQGIGQLIPCWPKDKGNTLLANSATIFAGISDHDTSKLVSSMLGSETRVVESGGSSTSGGSNRGGSQGPHNESSSFGTNWGWSNSENWQQVARPLATPDELTSLSPRYCITFPTGAIRRPILTYLARWFENPRLLRTPSWFAGFRAAGRSLAGALLFLASSLVLAATLTQMMTRFSSTSDPSSAPQSSPPPVITNYP